MKREAAEKFVDLLGAYIYHSVKDCQGSCEQDLTETRKALIDGLTTPTSESSAANPPPQAEHSSRVKQCKFCDKQIAWLRTPKFTDKDGKPAGNKPMPVEVNSYREGDEIFNSDRHITHFGNCAGYQR